MAQERINGIEPSSSAWKADALTVVLYSQMWTLRGLNPRPSDYESAALTN